MTTETDAIFRVRFHGRGGQGVKTASRILGTALFHEGFEVQDAPRYGAERRGAPIFAYVRAAHHPIQERGIILAPDLVVVVDDSVVAIPAAGVVVGVQPSTVVLMHTAEPTQVWQERLSLRCRLRVLAPDAGARERDAGVRLVGAAARLLGVVREASLIRAIHDELGGLGEEAVHRNARIARAAYQAMREYDSSVIPGRPADAASYPTPAWVDLMVEPSAMSAPAIHVAATSERQATGLWRTARPVLDKERCHRCTWLCGSFCPDGSVSLDAEGYPVIDLEHCKGCMICVAQCPHHAMDIVAERAEAKA